MNQATVLSFALAAAACTLGSQAAAAEPGPSVDVAAATTAWACDPGQKGFVERRILAKAEQGFDAVRGYVYITRSIHQLDLLKTLDWIVAQRAGRGACTLALAGATGAAER